MPWWGSGCFLISPTIINSVSSLWLPSPAQPSSAQRVSGSLSPVISLIEAAGLLDTTETVETGHRHYRDLDYFSYDVAQQKTPSFIKEEQKLGWVWTLFCCKTEHASVAQFENKILLEILRYEEIWPDMRFPVKYWIILTTSLDTFGPFSHVHMTEVYLQTSCSNAVTYRAIL